MPTVYASDVRDALNLTPADIPDSKVLKMIKRAEVTIELELEKQLDYRLAQMWRKKPSRCLLRSTRSVTCQVERLLA